jgi:hypothetical protein
MENKKLSLAELKAKANAITTAEALNAIKGGATQGCGGLSSAPTGNGPASGQPLKVIVTTGGTSTNSGR